MFRLCEGLHLNQYLHQSGSTEISFRIDIFYRWFSFTFSPSCSFTLFIFCNSIHSFCVVIWPREPGYLLQYPTRTLNTRAVCISQYQIYIFDNFFEMWFIVCSLVGSGSKIFWSSFAMLNVCKWSIYMVQCLVFAINTWYFDAHVKVKYKRWIHTEHKVTEQGNHVSIHTWTFIKRNQRQEIASIIIMFQAKKKFRTSLHESMNLKSLPRRGYIFYRNKSKIGSSSFWWQKTKHECSWIV